MYEIIIPKSAELFDIRKALNALPEKIPNLPVGVKGVYLVERAENRPQREDCTMFTFQQHENPFKASGIVERTHPRSGFIANAYAYYLDENDGFMHIGRVTSDGFIISKWGRGHVYKHLPYLTPYHYGNKIVFYAP